MKTARGSLVVLLACAATTSSAAPPASTRTPAVEVEPRLWPEAGADATPPPAPESRRVLRVSLKGTYGDESTPFERDSLRLRVEAEFPETLIRLEPVLSRYRDADSELTRSSLGVLLRQMLPLELVVRGDVRFFFIGSNDSSSDVGIEYGIELQSRLASGSLELRLGARRRSLIDAPPGWEPVASLQDPGYGGSTIASLRERILLSEGTLGLSWSPLRGSWSYLNFSLGAIDGNLRRSLTAGAGLDLLAASGVVTPWSVTVLYGLDELAFARVSTRYWSPEHSLIHNAGVDVRWRSASGRTYGVEASLTFGTDVSLGYFAGAFARQPLGDGLALEGRFRVADNSIFRLFNSCLAVVAEM